ncbi:unnamed protein product [Blepharisma stoltei]|uniref:uridine/cytidine kinase n=1 Tax=Blepharisma stoltei TaxID=1481888 RepID=A0AAU9J4A3_9CILI|nr:unnamed protein product [Blepharisma stoltei]
MAGTPIFIGVCGGTASGKTTLCNRISEALGAECTVLGMDHFYKGLTEEELPLVHEYNFDHPNSLDFDEMFIAIQKLLRREDADIPIYDFKTHSRKPERQMIKHANLILFEGILAFYDKRLRDLMKLKIFVQTDDDIRLCRRLLRDSTERGRHPDGILNQYFKFVKPSYDEYIRPTMKYADIIVPHGAHNDVAIEFVVMNLKNYLGMPLN